MHFLKKVGEEVSNKSKKTTFAASFAAVPDAASGDNVDRAIFKEESYVFVFIVCIV